VCGRPADQPEEELATYRPTQAVSEYFRGAFAQNHGIVGLLFRSSRKQGGMCWWVEADRAVAALRAFAASFASTDESRPQGAGFRSP
jgi:hypothetical protein